MHLVKALVATFIGTYALVFIGAGALFASEPGSFVAIALAHGFVTMALACSFGKESNSCLNRATVLGVLTADEGRFAAAAPVVLARFAGGTSDGLALAVVYGAHAAHSLGMTKVKFNVTSHAGGAWLEAIGTFFLMTVFLNVALRGVAGKFAPFAVGTAVVFRIMSFGPVTGAAADPRMHRRSGDWHGKGDRGDPVDDRSVRRSHRRDLALRAFFANKMGDEKESGKSEKAAFQPTRFSF